MNIQLQEIKSLYIKNRLTEGVDFKRYEWLKTTGYAYINTKVKGNQNSEIEVIAIQRTNPTFKSITLYGSVPTHNGYSSISFNVSTTTEKNRLSKFGNRTLALSDYKLNEEYIIFQSKDILSVNGKVVSNIQASNTFESGEIYLFSTNINNDNSNYNNRELWIKGFSIRNVISLKPCQLLRSIPATLDANNIARQAGECGMYDSITGKFYGNVANSGTFTVEGDVEPETHTGLQQIYQNKLIEGVDYETYDWLVQGENGGACIDTKINDLTDFSTIKVHYYVTGQPSRIFGREAINAQHYGQLLILISNDNTKTQIYCPKGYIFKNVDKDQTMNIDFDNQQVTLNNETVSVTVDKALTNQTMKVFTRYPHEAKVGVKFAEVTFTTTTNGDILHLVPCTLLRSIPRNLDAQCKERKAGECGMIDLINGKFYGNVASNGTFTVENDNNE